MKRKELKEGCLYEVNGRIYRDNDGILENYYQGHWIQSGLTEIDIDKLVFKKTPLCMMGEKSCEHKHTNDETLEITNVKVTQQRLYTRMMAKEEQIEDLDMQLIGYKEAYNHFKRCMSELGEEVDDE